MTEFVFQDFDLMKQLKPEQHEFLLQIGLLRSMVGAKFSFSSKFEHNNPIQFVNDLFNSEALQHNFFLPDITGKRSVRITGKQSVDINDCTVTARHESALMPALSERYCSNETFKGMSPTKLEFIDMDVSCLLDAALFDNTCKDYSTFTPVWRDEVLCQIFAVLKAGGSMNQPSDKISDYVNLSTDIYKQFVQPVRLEAEEKLTLKHIFAYRVNNISNGDLFPTNPDLENHPGNKCLVIVDGLRRFAYIFYNVVWV
ncbi:Conserved_hypothetical protein [Hexamita inflata]|uniref:Cilia- and flagella-associated protein 300 n=1 Tax=Hexamita inflata TaxID=28002 RepID=A0AA86TW98_9EUKA|nr:Conserved hypothetical protein [Hexamita inflata]CAI9931179.1 Conserved hypothetical protein [Hexamita inflata]